MQPYEQFKYRQKDTYAKVMKIIFFHVVLLKVQCNMSKNWKQTNSMAASVIFLLYTVQ